MASKWQEQLRSAQKTCLVQDGRRKIHFTFPDGTEMAEEYDIKSGALVVRKWRRPKMLGAKDNKWDYEVGELLSVAKSLDTEGLMESSSNPVFVRLDTKAAFQWRIRNLPYPIQTYMVTVDEDQKNIIIRTTNKKYYKKFDIPDMARAELMLFQDSIQVAHANNTLIVTYSKPKEILQMEKQIEEEMKKLKASKDGDVDCRPS